MSWAMPSERHHFSPTEPRDLWLETSLNIQIADSLMDCFQIRSHHFSNFCCIAAPKLAWHPHFGKPLWIVRRPMVRFDAAPPNQGQICLQLQLHICNRHPVATSNWQPPWMLNLPLIGFEWSGWESTLAEKTSILWVFSVLPMFENFENTKTNKCPECMDLNSGPCVLRIWKFVKLKNINTNLNI